MIDDSVAKGATVIISSQTPDNPFDNSTTIINDPPRVSEFYVTCPGAVTSKPGGSYSLLVMPKMRRLPRYYHWYFLNYNIEV